MDRSFLAYMAIGIGFIYLITNFIGDIQESDENLRNSAYDQKHQFSQYYGKDSIGRDVLNLYGVDVQMQISAWNESKLREEYVEFFPDFSEMNKFVKERVNAKELSAKLAKQLTDIEDRFLVGTVSMEQAKIELGKL